MKNCKSRSIIQCWVDSVALLEVLAKEADRGRIGKVVITDDMIRKSKVEDLKKLWRITFQWEVRIRTQAVQAYWCYLLKTSQPAYFNINILITGELQRKIQADSGRDKD